MPALEIAKFLIGPFERILGRFVPDKSKISEMAHELAMTVEEQAHAQIMGQLKVNEAQAQHGSIFVAGARPAIMWICGAGLAWNFVIQPIIMWLAFLMPVCPPLEGGGFDYSGGFCVPDLSEAPRLQIGELTTILLGMLGLGGMRSYEKKNGVARTMINGKGDA